MRVTLFNDVRAATLETHTCDWPAVVAMCSNPPVFQEKQQCPLIKLAEFGNQMSPRGSLRHDENILAVYGVECDYDGGIMSPSDAVTLLNGLEAVVYTSPSHTTNTPRWRVLAPFSRPLQPHERREMVARINGSLGGILAPESFTLSQSFYIGRVAGAEYEWHVSHGQCVDQLVNLPVIYPVVANVQHRIEPREVTDETIEELRSALKSISTDDYPERIAVGQALYELGDAGYLLWFEWLGDREYKHETHDKWETFTASRTGFESVFAKAQAAGWVNPKARKPIDTSVIGFGASEPLTFNGGFASISDQQQMFAGCVYVQSTNQVLIPGGKLLDKARFDVHFGGYLFALGHGNDKTDKSAWTAFTQSQATRWPRADTICFKPEHPAGMIIDGAANVWWPINTPREPGDVSLFLGHLEKLLPNNDDRDKLIAYMAALLQYPGVKFQWAPVIQGTKGNGKTFIVSCMEFCVGERYAYMPNAKGIDSNFNAWLRGKLFVGVEELSVYHKKEVLETLLTKITNRRIEIEGKGVNQEMGDNRANFMFCINPKNGIPIDKDERRYAIFHTAQQSKDDIIRDGMNGSYFPNLYHWGRTVGFARVNYWLRNYAIPDELNPATSMQRAPETSSTADAIEWSMGPIEQEILEAIGRGDPGFIGGWISTIMLGRLLERRKTTVRMQMEIIEGMGYIRHPALHDGRVNNQVMPDGGKPRLFVKAGHIALNETRPAEVAKMYTSAQGVTFGSVPMMQQQL